MYGQIKLYVKNTTSFSNKVAPLSETENFFFTSRNGVFQEESLSAFLFAMFINDLNDFLQSKDVGITLENLLLAVLLFADDMVVFSESRKGLQNGLDALSDYCDKWGLTVNVSKTKCVAFRRGGRIGALDRWKYKSDEIETVSHFKYLGFVFGSSGKFSKGIQSLTDQAQRALFGLKSLLHQYPEMSVNTKISLFNTLISPIMSYSCEIWGFCEAVQLERLYIGFLKSTLGVRKSVPNAFIYNELGVFPLTIGRQNRIIKYWLKILNLKANNPVKIVYKLLLKDIEDSNGTTNWASLLKATLEKVGFGYIWLQQYVDSEKKFISEFSQRIHDIFLQTCHGDIQSVSDNRLYKYLGPVAERPLYLSEIKENHIRTAISKLRLGSHNFMIERGRWQCPKIDLSARTCDVCEELEDEFHIILKCKRFSNLRTKYLPKLLTDRPSMYMFINFLDTADGKNLKSFGIFCHKVLIEYNNSVV